MPPFEHSFNLVLNAHYNKRCQNLRKLEMIVGVE